MSASQPQLAANRLNALHSTGPTTPEGKAAVSQNARTHGLSAATLPNSPEFAAHVLNYQTQFPTDSPVLQDMVRELAFLAWKLNQFPAIESQLLQQEAARLSADEPDTTFDTPTIMARQFATDKPGPLLAFWKLQDRILSRFMSLTTRLTKLLNEATPDPDPAPQTPRAQNKPNPPTPSPINTYHSPPADPFTFPTVPNPAAQNKANPSPAQRLRAAVQSVLPSPLTGIGGTGIPACR